MKKFTRKIYNKKLVALGLSSFMGIGLTSTGFAAWVMSKDANETPEGSVNVAVITDASATIKLLDDYATKEGNTWKLKENFSFNAPEDDIEGRLRSDKTGPKECLTVTLKGVVEADVKYNLTAQILDLPDGIEAAMTEGYIAWNPEYTDYTSVTSVDLDESGAFTITLGFVWGVEFGGVNPSIYYDEVAEGIAKDDATMQSELLTFYQIIRGLSEKPTSFDGLSSYNGTFKIQLSASPAPVETDPVA